MAALTEQDVIVPADVPPEMKQEYIQNYLEITKGTGNIMLFAGDQKVEHLNDDFYGTIKVDKQDVRIPKDDANPEHLFKIAQKANVGVLATQLGLIARYGPTYTDVPYLVKLNSKSNKVKTEQKDPLSATWIDVEQVVDVKKNSGLNILGVGFTIYVGSEFEHIMFREAAQVAYKAHQHGLITVFWMYPRGKAVKDEKDAHLIAGAAGVGATLGADFVKVNYPKPADDLSSAEALKEAVQAAGRTKVITAGGSSKPVKEFLQETYDQIHVSGCGGNATGRNIHQKTFDEAVRLANAISAIVLEGKTIGEAYTIYMG